MGEEKKGFFARLKEGLTKTRDNIVKGLDSVFNGFSEIDDYFYCGTGKVFWQGGHSRQNERTDYVPAG